MKKLFTGILLVFAVVSSNAQETSMRFTMQEAIDYAIKNSYNTQVAKKDIESAKKQKWETTTIGLPQINAQVDYQNWLKQQVSLIPAEFFGGNPGEFMPVQFGTDQSVNAAVTLNQLIFDGSYLVGLQSAKTYLKISEQANEKTELVTREAVINAYGNVLIVEKNIEILKGNIQVLNKNLEETRKIYENGLTEEEDVEQLEITLGNLKSTLNANERMQTIAYGMLNIAIGAPVETELVLVDSLDSLIEKNIDFNLISSSFNVENHIDYKIAANDKESNRLLVKYEQSQALPSLSAFVNFGYTANSNEFDFINGNAEWFDYSLMGVSLKVPLFSSLARSAKTQRAKINFDISDIRLRETTQKLSLQAKQAKSDYQLSIENYQTAQKNLKLAERIEKKQRVKFFEGISTSFDLSQAQNQLYTQQQNYVQSMLDVIAKKASLENALNIPLNK